MTTFTTLDKSRRNVMITDLDQSDSQQMEPNQSKQQQQRGAQRKKRSTEKCLRTISGNFKRRSRSAECSAGQEEQSTTPATSKANTYFNELLQSKDKQMEQLLQRLATLHEFNEQFAEENKKLRNDVQLLDEKVAQLKQRIKSCINCRKLQTQLQQALETTATVNSDIEMLKTLVYRLNVQIEYYQDRQRNAANNNNNNETSASTPTSAAATTSAQPPKTMPNQTSWNDSIHTSTLAPLLKSYDEMLKEKQELLQQYKQEFESFTGELKSVLEENTRLLQLNESLKRDFGAWREERTRLQAQADVCRAKAEAQSRKSDLAKEKLVEVMRCYEQKMQSLVLDMEHMQAAYTRCKSELATLKSLTAPPQESIAHSLQECKELLEQLKTQHSREKATLEKQLLELREQKADGSQSVQTLKAVHAELKQNFEQQSDGLEELRRRNATLQRTTEKVKRSRDRLKARLRIALQWAQKLEEGQNNMQNTWDALKRLEAIVKHKESQVRGLHARHLEELDKMQQKLHQKEETIRKILKGKLETTSGC